jgi:CPA1 family monovalent cation:H+ antiporter
VNLVDLAALLVTLSALFAYVNFRYLKLPPTIGQMLLALVLSIFLAIIARAHPPAREMVASLLGPIDFEQLLLHGMLGFLLFAGALQVDVGELRRQVGVVLTLATLGVFLSTVIVGTILYFILQALGLEVSFLLCLLFGALISPTDPISVLSILRRQNAPPEIQTQISGESLFNDGVGVVLFTSLLASLVAGGAAERPGLASIALLFLREAVGGALLGLAMGYVTYRLLKSVDKYQVEILISLALVMGGYSLSDMLGVSGPIAMVVAGLLIGHTGRAFAMSKTTREHLDAFWELIDEFLTAVLFVIIGLEVLVVPLRWTYLLAGFAAIPVVLLARFGSVSLLAAAVHRIAPLGRHAIPLMTWGALRGGISVAMALSLHHHLRHQESRSTDVVVVMTYVVVVFSILVQGLTYGRLVRRLVPQQAP